MIPRMSEPQEPRGPLHAVRVLEVGGIGPNPFAGMVLADLGAEVLRLDRAAPPPGFPDPTLRGRQAVALDLKHPEGRATLLELCQRADALIEGFRPGVMERLGLGPDDALQRNPALVYGRMTGWGQEGPLAQVAGHDINYISVSGALGASRRAGERPLFALNLVGDYGGGAMLLLVGVLSALLEARASGRGQVVDAAMVDGSAMLTTLIHGLRAMGQWPGPPGTNLLDSGAHFYEVYEARDGGHVAVGALEPQFYAELMRVLDLTETPPQHDRSQWPELRSQIAARFKERSRDEWAEAFAGTDACVAPVLTWSEAAEHPHIKARNTFVRRDGVLQPAPAPRFSRTPAEMAAAPRSGGADTHAVLSEWGIEGVDDLLASGAAVQS